MHWLKSKDIPEEYSICRNREMGVNTITVAQSLLPTRSRVRFVRQMYAHYRERERDYWEAMFAPHANDPKRLWATFNDLLGRHGSGCHSNTPAFSAKDFAANCESKLGSIRFDTPPIPPSRVADDRSSSSGHVEGNLFRRTPLSNLVVCSKIDSLPMIQDYNVYSFPPSPLQPVSSRGCSSWLTKDSLPCSSSVTDSTSKTRPAFGQSQMYPSSQKQ